MTNLNFLAGSIHAQNKAKGFWDEERQVGTLLALVHSELSEALEADRKGRHFNKSTNDIVINKEDWEYKKENTKTLFEAKIKDTFEDEIADAVIRLLDMCGAMGIDLEYHIKNKLEYNKTRGQKHGKNY